MKSFIYYILILFLLSNSNINALEVQFQPPKSNFPNFGGFPQTSKLKTTVTGQGIIGKFFKDPNSNISQSGFEFPSNRKVNYMNSSGLWVGGIVDGDTLVSTSICDELIISSGAQSFRKITDFHPPLLDGDTASTVLYKRDYGEIFHTTFADTFVPNYNFFSLFIDKHKPMNLQVTLKTFTKNKPPFKNIVLLDFIITNKGSKIINSTYVGMYLDEYVGGVCDQTFRSDDLIGSFQNEGVVYVFDNDGELNISGCNEEKATGALAIKTMRTYPAPTDTNFNWWTNNFGPRKKGTEDIPYRDISYGEFGAPYGDSNRYYIMSQPAWDFDQYLTKQILKSDTTWLTITDTALTSISKGRNSDFLLSLGPFELLPDSSLRTVFALLGSEFIHLDKNNYQNLQDEKFEEYYNNLYFGVFSENVNLAKLLTNDYLNPLHGPVGFKQTPVSSTSTLLTWDNHVFQDVIDYNIYIKEVPKEYLLTPKIVQPNIEFEELPTSSIFYKSITNNIIIENLEPGKIYFAIVAHNTLNGEGNFSESIIIGADNPFIKPSKVYPAHKFAQIDPERNFATIKWKFQDNSDIEYYKIYRSKDSISAFKRYTPFLYSRIEAIPFSYQQCFDTNDSTICFYEWKAYDSVLSNIQIYNDSLTKDGYFYWITAVNKYGFESEFSSLIRATPSPSIKKDIVAIIGSSNNINNFVYKDSLIRYFNDLLQGYDYDLYHWDDTVVSSLNCSTETCISWEDLANYKLIIINEFPAPQILTHDLETKTSLFSKLSDLGRNIAFFGIPRGETKVDLTLQADTIFYNETSFEHNYMGIKNTIINTWFNTYDFFGAIDSFGGFNTAIPNSQSLPFLPITSYPSFYTPFIKQLFNVDGYLPFTPAFTTVGNATILYEYQSAFPETSILQGKPIGVLKENNSSKFFTFGFHLWAMEPQPARELVDYLFDSQIEYYPTNQIPNFVTLNQNYPNPFNSSTTISFSLPENYNVSLDIFNILGQNIKSLLQNEELQTGNHSIPWDGKNEQNNDVSTGIYFYRLKIQEFSVTSKMVILK